MSAKTLPCSAEKIKEIAAEYGTPFHIYIEKDMRENARKLVKAFAWAPAFKEYFAVKALPNPYIMKILKEEGFGGDCSSLAELILCEKVGITGENICFTSNDTPAEEFAKAKELGAIINLDDITHIDYLAKETGLPDLLAFRYNPGPLREGGNAIIGYPEEAKYGMTREQIFAGIEKAKAMGVKRFGLHTMVVSNELNVDYLIGTATMMFELAVEVKERLGVPVEFLNLGGGIGIPYLPEQEPVDLIAFGQGVKGEYERILIPAGLDHVKICLESGRMITGPYGYLAATALHEKNIYKHYIGLDACMANLMRPALYGSYHHITVVGKEDVPADTKYDITGSLCENNDKFAIGDILVIHDTGAHGSAMGFNYNGKLRCQELLLKEDGSVEVIRRAETLDDYFATLDFSRL